MRKKFDNNTFCATGNICARARGPSIRRSLSSNHTNKQIDLQVIKTHSILWNLYQLIPTSSLKVIFDKVVGIRTNMFIFSPFVSHLGALKNN